MDQPQQSAVRMGKGPHQPTGFVGDVQIGADLEAVQALEDQPEGAEDAEGPPAEADVAAGPDPGNGRSIVSSRAQGGIVTDAMDGVGERRRSSGGRRVSPEGPEPGS